MAHDWLAAETDHVARSRALQQAGHPAQAAFAQLVKAASSDGALSHKQKELIALAISVAVRCEGCIVFHARACVRLKVSREELLDMLAVCVEMGGGPSSIYAAQALECFDQMQRAAA